MLNLGTNWEEIHWPDNWTATTIDGRRSAQFEETLLCVVPCPAVFRNCILTFTTVSQKPE